MEPHTRIIRARRLRDMPPGTRDICKPNNTNVPFFSTIEEYEQRIIPELPGGADPVRDRPWLVEPGMLSIEVYEAILGLHGPFPPRRLPLTRYICQSGVLQYRRWRRARVPASAAEDERLREERDICFTLVSGEESSAITAFLGRYNVFTLPNCKMVTPFGQPQMPDRANEGVHSKVCQDLGFGTDDAEYPRSAPPPGVIPIGNTRIFAWCLPGADGIPRDGRATVDCGIQRIEWPYRRRPSSLVLKAPTNYEI